MAYRTARSKIIQALTTLFKTIDGTGDFETNLFNNVESRLKFWDEVNDFPYVCVVAGSEQREYHPSDFAWAFLSVNIRAYVNQEGAQEALEKVLSDLEYILDQNQNLTYDTGRTITEARLLSISTDEGVLDPIGVGEMSVLVRYDLGN